MWTMCQYVGLYTNTLSNRYEDMYGMMIYEINCEIKIIQSKHRENNLKTVKTDYIRKKRNAFLMNVKTCA